jgi:hypothetical protein
MKTLIGIQSHLLWTSGVVVFSFSCSCLCESGMLRNYARMCTQSLHHWFTIFFLVLLLYCIEYSVSETSRLCLLCQVFVESPHRQHTAFAFSFSWLLVQCSCGSSKPLFNCGLSTAYCSKLSTSVTCWCAMVSCYWCLFKLGFISLIPLSPNAPLTSRSTNRYIGDCLIMVLQMVLLVLPLHNSEVFVQLQRGAGVACILLSPFAFYCIIL